MRAEDFEFDRAFVTVSTNLVIPEPGMGAEEMAGAVRVLCPRCGPNTQAAISTCRLIEDTQAHVLTCVALSCGHTWHRTIRNIGGIFPGSPRNATFAPCDCPPETASR